MSADADRIEFTCPTCGAQHNRGYVNGVDTFRCLKCGYVGPGDVRTYEFTNADINAAYAAGHDDAPGDLRDGLAACKAALDRERAAHARTLRERDVLGSAARLADGELMDERRDHERTRAELVEAREVAQRNAADCQHLRRSAITLTTERDAAQADAAAMRAALRLWDRDLRDDWETRASADTLTAHHAAINGTAGRALAERVTLWRELERRAQTIRQGHDTIDGGCHCGICELSRKLAAVDAAPAGKSPGQT